MSIVLNRLATNNNVKILIMKFQKGNQAWKLRSKHGRDTLFKTPELLWKAACEYFQWCEDNPLYETKAFASQGVVTTEKIPAMRAMLLSQLCFYLHCNEAYFRTFKKQMSERTDDFNTVISDIEQVIFSQKFQGAAANLLNGNIVSMELGLKSKSEITGEDGKPLIPDNKINLTIDGKMIMLE